MPRLGNLLNWQTSAAQEIAVGEVTLTPYAQALILRWPNSGWVWNRPVAIEIRQNGKVRREPIVDVTLAAQILLGALTILFGLIVLIPRCKRR